VWESFVKNYLSLSSVAGALGVFFVLGLSGCSANFGNVSSSSTQTAMHIRGVVHGGQQPLTGAHVYMYAASTTAYGGPEFFASAGPTGNASTSLLTSATGNPADTTGHFYVVTDAGGNFDINGAFACSPGQQVYLYSTGGDPQLSGEGVSGFSNLAASLLAVVGDCASIAPSAAFPGVTSVAMNEITTVAAAYALAGFATDPLHIGAPSAVAGHALSGIGLANAFHTALNIVDQSSGVPNPTLPNNSNATVPVTRINTVADFLAACVNSQGLNASGCSVLFPNTAYKTFVTDTATAAIYFAQHPGGNLGPLLTLATNASPFQPFVSSANDLSLGINYTGGGLSLPEGVAIDSAGNAWVTNFLNSAVTEISSTGTYLSGANGYTGGGLLNPAGIAIDGSGNAWVTNDSGASVTKLSSTGAPLSGTSGYTGGGLNQPFGIAIDGSGNAWVANGSDHSVIKLSSTGAFLSGANGYTDASLKEPRGIAIDGSGNAWMANFAGGSVTELSNAGAVLSGVNGYGGGLKDAQGVAIDRSGVAWVADAGNNSVFEFTPPVTTAFVIAGLGLNSPLGTAVDGDGNVWVANSGAQSVTEIVNIAASASGTSFYTGGGLNEPFGIAIDGSGNVWATNAAGNSVTEIIGLGVPVITPIAAGLPVIPTKDGTSNLGTRP
jgi:streptogramin lyase